jgi:hypothetical protein
MRWTLRDWNSWDLDCPKSLNFLNTIARPKHLASLRGREYCAEKNFEALVKPTSTHSRGPLLRR